MESLTNYDKLFDIKSKYVIATNDTILCLNQDYASYKGMHFGYRRFDFVTFYVAITKYLK